MTTVKVHKIFYNSVLVDSEIDFQGYEKNVEWKYSVKGYRRYSLRCLSTSIIVGVHSNATTFHFFSKCFWPTQQQSHNKIIFEYIFAISSMKNFKQFFSSFYHVLKTDKMFTHRYGFSFTIWSYVTCHMFYSFVLVQYERMLLCYYHFAIILITVGDFNESYCGIV